MFLITLTWVTTSFAYPMAMQKLYQTESFYVADNNLQFVWYTPAAVILKPATQKEWKKRLQEDVRQFSLFQHYHPPFSSSSSWKINPYYQPRKYESDVLRDFYSSYDMPGSVQGRLLSLARMGLVAIPREEIDSQSKRHCPINHDKQGDMNLLFFPVPYYVISKLLLKSFSKKMFSSDRGIQIFHGSYSYLYLERKAN